MRRLMPIVAEGQNANPDKRTPPLPLRAGARTPARNFEYCSAMRGHLVWNSLDRAFLSPDGRSRHRFDHLAGTFRIGDPVLVEFVRADGVTASVLTRVDHAGIAAVHQLEEVVLRLHVAPGVAYQRHRELGVLYAVLFLATFPQRAAIKADDRGVTEIGVDAIEARRIGDGHIDIVRPCHRLRHHYLLILRRIHVALTADNQLRTPHRAVAPDLREVAVVTDDQADLHALRAVGYVGAIAGVPALDWHPRHDLAILLNHLALVVHQDQRVVRRLVRMLFMALAGERKNAPDFRLAAGFRKNFRLLSRYDRRRVVHLLGVVHDPVGRIFRENHQIHSRQAGFHSDHHIGDLFGVSQHLRLGVEARHFVVHDGDADRVLAG